MKVPPCLRDHFKQHNYCTKLWCIYDGDYLRCDRLEVSSIALTYALLSRPDSLRSQCNNPGR
jgi:hypothetical protein